MQINPPFDRSLPCPACQQEVRQVSALLHNTFTRWPDGKAFVRLNDLRRTPIPTELTVPHPVAQELMDVARALVAACDGMTDEGHRVRWPPSVAERVGELAPRVKAALDAFDPLSDAHYHDSRHADGDENVLHASKGSRWAGFVAPNYEATRYNHTVDAVTEGGDLRHVVCDTRLRVHEHFRTDLRRDLTFFAKIWCPTCRINAPLDQWALSAAAAPVPEA